MRVLYDAGALTAADRNDRRMWAEHRARLEAGILPRTTAPVIAQVSRSPRQVSLRRLLRACEVEPFHPSQAHPVGVLLARSGTRDVVDAQLALIASATGATVVTSDVEDLQRLAAHLPTPFRLHPI